MFGHRALHLWDEKTRIVVADDETGVLGQGFEQASLLAIFVFDKGIEAYVVFFEMRDVGGHILQHEAMQPVARPWVVDFQSRQHHEGAA